MPQKSDYSWLLYELQPVTSDQLHYLYTEIKVFLWSLPSLLNYARGFPTLLSQIPRKFIFGFITWLMLWRCSAYFNVASLYFMASCVLLMMLNLGERQAGELSAYSVFNEGFARLLGTMTAEQIDREMRHEVAAGDEILPPIAVRDDGGGNDVDRRGGARRSNKKKRRNYENRELRRRERAREDEENEIWSD